MLMLNLIIKIQDLSCPANGKKREQRNPFSPERSRLLTCGQMSEPINVG